jgi:hypothetical protein
MLLTGLSMFDSRKKLYDLTLSDYPRMNNEDRKELHKHYKNLSGYKERVYSNKEAMQKL